MVKTSKEYDLIVIGTGPAGEKAAVKAAYFGHKVAIIEKDSAYGGAGVKTGTVPSKTLKETALYLSGKYDSGLYGIERKLQEKASVKHFLYRKNLIVKSISEEVHHNLEIHKVDIYQGSASFIDEHHLEIKGGESVVIKGEYIIIATGSYPYHPPGIPFDGNYIHDSDTILEIDRMPETICIVGAGVIGCEYATIFSTLGSKVYLVNSHNKILQFLDGEITNALVEQMKRDKVEILFDTRVESVAIKETDDGKKAYAKLTSDVTIEADMFLYGAGRCGNIGTLQCENAGLKTGKRETIIVDKEYRSNTPNIFAVGDVIGFPALASISMDQGRVAVAHMFGLSDVEHIADQYPLGMYTVPEVSMIGLTEKEALDQNIDVCAGRARYSDLTRGRIMGTKQGFLKIVFNRADNTILGVHIIGPIATELIHFGMVLVESKKPIEYCISIAINSPTLHELYKYAAYDGLGNKSGHKIKK